MALLESPTKTNACPALLNFCGAEGLQVGLLVGCRREDFQQRRHLLPHVIACEKQGTVAVASALQSRLVEHSGGAALPEHR